MRIRNLIAFVVVCAAGFGIGLNTPAEPVFAPQGEPVVTAVEPMAPANVRAQEAVRSVFAPWRFRTGVVCVLASPNTIWPVRDAAARFNSHPDLVVTVRTSCAGFPRTQQIHVTYYSTTAPACGVTIAPYFPSSGLIGDVVRVKINVHPKWRAGCYANATMRAHVVSHEFGHGFGLAHSTDDSVMSNWKPWLTYWDGRKLAARHPW